MDIKLNQEIMPFIKFLIYLEDHPRNKDGHIEEIHIKEICAACHFQKPLVEELFEALQKRGWLLYTAVDDVYSITIKKRN